MGSHSAPARDWQPVTDALLVRILGRYEVVRDNEPDFTPSDAISLALLSKSENSRLEFYKYYYERAFDAVVSGLELASKETLISAVRKFALAPRDLNPGWHACLLLRHKVQALIENLPSTVFAAAHDGPTDAASAVVDWYAEEASRAVCGVERIDAAICSFLGWDPGRRVSFTTLVSEHNFPDRSQLKTFFRPKGLQAGYKSYEAPR